MDSNKKNKTRNLILLVIAILIIVLALTYLTKSKIELFYASDSVIDFIKKLTEQKEQESKYKNIIIYYIHQSSSYI